MTVREEIILAGLQVARGVADELGECPPTLFAVRSDGRSDWTTPIILENPGEFALAAQKAGVSAVVLIGSHALVDPEHNDSQLLRIYAGLVNANGDVLVAGKQQRWKREPEWSPASIVRGPFPVGGWAV